MTLEKHIIAKKAEKKKDNKYSVNSKGEFSFANRKEKIKTAKGRKISSTLWITRTLRDPYLQAAKIDNFVSRSAYKIIQIDDKYSVFSPGQKVIDLGAAPGGWMQAVWEKIKHKNAYLIGVDLLPIEVDKILAIGKHADKISFIQGDFTDAEVRQNIKNKTNGALFDVICSDMAPNTIGVRSADHLAIVNLVEEVERFAKLYLAIGGNLVMKVFQGEEQNNIFSRLKKDFTKVAYFKPQASRAQSSEMYLIAIGKKADNGI